MCTQKIILDADNHFVNCIVHMPDYKARVILIAGPNFPLTHAYSFFSKE